MNINRRQLLSSAAGFAAVPSWFAAPAPGVTKYVRFQKGSTIAYGVLEGDTIRTVRGDLFGKLEQTSATSKLSEVKLLNPIVPPKILAVGLNYKSHIGARKPPANPEIFYKPITCLRSPGESIVIPSDSKNTHYEGELVVVIGKEASRVPKEKAGDVIFGVTCGNDVSERDWQNGAEKDLQWWRAKGADTFGPCGPAIVRGLDYSKLMLRTRLNGKVVQEQNTSDLLFDCHDIVSFVSRYVKLTPGDLIYTGTPGSTSKMSPGDVVEVDIEGIGILKNPVA